MRRYVAAVSVLSVVCLGIALVALSDRSSTTGGPGLDQATEVVIFASAADGGITYSTDSAQGARLVDLLEEARPVGPPGGETTPSYRIVFKRGEVVLTTVSFSEGDPVLRLQTGNSVSGVVGSDFRGCG